MYGRYKCNGISETSNAGRKSSLVGLRVGLDVQKKCQSRTFCFDIGWPLKSRAGGEDSL